MRTRSGSRTRPNPLIARPRRSPRYSAETGPIRSRKGRSVAIGAKPLPAGRGADRAAFPSFLRHERGDGKPGRFGDSPVESHPRRQLRNDASVGLRSAGRFKRGSERLDPPFDVDERAAAFGKGRGRKQDIGGLGDLIPVRGLNDQQLRLDGQRRRRRTGQIERLDALFADAFDDLFPGEARPGESKVQRVERPLVDDVAQREDADSGKEGKVRESFEGPFGVRRPNKVRSGEDDQGLLPGEAPDEGPDLFSRYPGRRADRAGPGDLRLFGAQGPREPG